MTRYYVFITILCSCVFSLVIVTLLVAGTPFEQKAISLDKQRLKSFEEIKYQVQSHSYTKGIPDSLSEINSSKSNYYIKSLNDPETGRPYEYKKISDTSFQLCATFSADSSKQDQYTLESLKASKNIYKKGYSCLTYEIKNSSTYNYARPTQKPTATPIPTKTPEQLKSLQDAEERDQKRRDDAVSILSNILRYIEKNQGQFPGKLSNATSFTKQISSSDANLCNDITAQYSKIPTGQNTWLPIDPSLGSDKFVANCNNYDSGYVIYFDGKSKITIRAPRAEIYPITSTGLIN